jgi:hypothetical protein
MTTTTKKSKQKKDDDGSEEWDTSDAKKLLEQDLLDGTVPLDRKKCRQ